MADRDLAADHFPEPDRRPRPVRRRAADRRHLHDRLEMMLSLLFPMFAVATTLINHLVLYPRTLR